MFILRTAKVAIWPRPHAQLEIHEAENAALVEAARQFRDHLDANLPFHRGARALFIFASSEGADPEMATPHGMATQNGHAQRTGSPRMLHTVGF